MADEPEDAVVVVLGLLLAENVMETARVWAVCVTARVGGEQKLSQVVQIASRAALCALAPGTAGYHGNR